MAVSVKFGTYDFTDTINSWVTRRNVTLDAASVPIRDGLSIQGGKLGPVEIELRGLLMGSTIAAVRTLKDSLLAGITNRTENLTLNDDRFVEARVAQFNEQWIEGAALLALEFVITFVSTLPYEQSVTLQSSTVVTTTASNQDFSITNAGNYPAYAKITVTAPGGGISNDLTVYNLTRNESFAYYGTIASGQSLVVDGMALPPSVENNGDDDIVLFSGDFIKIDAGINSFRINSVVGVSIKVEWRDTYV